MREVSRRRGVLALAAVFAMPVSVGAHAQPELATDPNIIVTGENLPDTSAMTKGPELKGVITARSGDKIKITGADGASTLSKPKRGRGSTANTSAIAATANRMSGPTNWSSMSPMRCAPGKPT